MVKSRSESDEHYVIDLCDRVLGCHALRQHGFDFLRADRRSNGTLGARLRVDAYYPQYQLVVEFLESQHRRRTGGRPTLSGIRRDLQRQLYHERREQLLPKHGVRFVGIWYLELAHVGSKLVRDDSQNLKAIRKILDSALS